MGVYYFLIGGGGGGGIHRIKQSISQREKVTQCWSCTNTNIQDVVSARVTYSLHHERRCFNHLTAMMMLLYVTLLA